MNHKQLKRDFLYAFWPRMTTNGFVGKTSEAAFWRSFNGGFGSVSFLFTERSEQLDVLLAAQIRFDDLESLKNVDREDLGEQDKLKTYSFGDELGYLMGKRAEMKWTIDEDTDLDELAEEISVQVMNTLVPYLEDYSNMENAFDLMMKDNGKNGELSEQHAVNAVGLAFLLGRDDLDGVIVGKSDLLRSNNQDMTEFSSFIQKIRGNHE